MFEALANARLVVFGECHGTAEAPAFVGDALAAVREPRALALEWPRELERPIADYLATGDRAALLDVAHPFWSYRDGRASQAMFALLERARDLGASVICFDGVFTSGEQRDAGMAEALLAAIEARPGVVIALCGNLHARTSSPRWMGWHLRRRHPDLIALDGRDAGGTAWVILGDQEPGVVTFPSSPQPSERGIRLYAARDEHGFDGEYQLGPITASLPLA